MQQASTALDSRYLYPFGMVENLAYLVGFSCFWPVLSSNALNANQLSGMFVTIRREVAMVGITNYCARSCYEFGRQEADPDY